MEKQKYLGLIAIIVIIFVSGCIQEQGSPANINLFASSKEGEAIRFYFLLEDANGRNIPGDGHVKLEIFDDLNNSLYYKEFDVKASEFIDYQFELTGQGIGKAYEWRVPISEIKKGISYIGLGRAVLTFVTPDGKKLYAEDTTVEIPTYTEEELTEMAEEEYNKNATNVNKTIRKGNFEVTVTKAGFFVLYEWGERKQYFRVDMQVKNVGSESDYFSTSEMVIIDDQGNQHETSDGTLDTFSKIYPGATKKGYILFEGVPENVTFVRLVFELGYDENFNPYLFEYNIRLK
ncbi:MAG: hypothetical protein DRP12_03255 [Candidatus Aenigmatarchaeota archaeon]|nr:MAG: hypothetical protein DRP12_03255 [Candidatus Aenigmarchaeota archaeon]